MCGFYVSLLYVFLLFSWFRFGCSFGVLVLLFIFWVWDEVISFSISPRERERDFSHGGNLFQDFKNWNSVYFQAMGGNWGIA
jgi:hypothetical protein